MPAFTQHIFVCGNTRPSDHPRGCCNPNGGDSLRSALKAAVQSRDVGPLVRVNSAGCLDQCECGPTVVIYPQGIWYGNVKLSDVDRVVEETICHGRIIKELLISDSMLNTRGRGPQSPSIAGKTP